jgi:hypothetical protein
LNPNWVEWLIGWTIGWTGLKSLEMGRFQKWLVKGSGLLLTHISLLSHALGGQVRPTDGGQAFRVIRNEKLWPLFTDNEWCVFLFTAARN